MKTHGKLFSNLIAAGFLLTAVFFLLRCFDIIHGMLLGWVIAPIWVAMLVLAVILLIGRAAKLGLALRLLPFVAALILALVFILNNALDLLAVNAYWYTMSGISIVATSLLAESKITQSSVAPSSERPGHLI